MNFDQYIQDINLSKTLEQVKTILISVKKEIDGILADRANSKSIFSMLKTFLSRSSRANELSNILGSINTQSSDSDLEQAIGRICALPSRVESVVPYEFIEAVRQVGNKFKINLNFKDKDIEKEEAIGSGNQGGTTFKCKFKNQQCVLKEINHTKIGHNPVESEILACKVLNNISCDYIAKPMFYARKGEKQANIIYQLAGGMNCKHFQNLVGNSNFGEKYKQKLFVLIVEQLLKVVEVLRKNGVAHGDMNHENYLISVEKKKVLVQVVDFGYFYKLKSKGNYTENDVKEMCHPVTSAIQFLNGIKFHYELLMQTRFGLFLDSSIRTKISENLSRLLYNGLLKSGGWPANYYWRSKKENLDKILEVDPDECYKIVGIFKNYIQNICPNSRGKPEEYRV